MTMGTAKQAENEVKKHEGVERENKEKISQINLFLMPSPSAQRC
jgi:hypothetical protein